MIEPTTIEIQFLLNTPKDIDFTPLVENNNELIYLIIFVLIICLPFPLYILSTIISFNKASGEREMPETPDERKMSMGKRLSKCLEFLGMAVDKIGNFKIGEILFVIRNIDKIEEILNNRKQDRKQDRNEYKKFDDRTKASLIIKFVEYINVLGLDSYNNVFEYIETNPHYTNEISKMLDDLPESIKKMLNLLTRISKISETKMGLNITVAFPQLLPLKYYKAYSSDNQKHQQYLEMIEKLLSFWKEKENEYRREKLDLLENAVNNFGEINANETILNVKDIQAKEYDLSVGNKVYLIRQIIKDINEFGIFAYDEIFETIKKNENYSDIISKMFNDLPEQIKNLLNLLLKISNECSSLSFQNIAELFPELLPKFLFNEFCEKKDEKKKENYLKMIETFLSFWKQKEEEANQTLYY